jgi:ribosomal protein L11 methyltransferase
MSRWVEVSLRADGESAEAIAEVLSRYGHQGVSIEQAGIPPDVWDETEVPPARQLTLRAYFPDDERLETTKRELEAALGHMRLMYPMPQPDYRSLDAEDWSESWKAHYQPVRIGKRLLIRPLWIDVTAAAGDIEIALDPGMAFGTGTHPTTQLCLEALERLLQPAQDVLDMGAGSGILAIAAAKLGARSVLALDIDPIAVEATAANARANGVRDKVIAEQGSLANVKRSARRFDLAVVNILARVILQLAEQQLGEILKPGGVMIFSGIIDTQLAEVEAALRRTGLRPYARRQQGDWMLIEAKRSAD